MKYSYESLIISIRINENGNPWLLTFDFYEEGAAQWLSKEMECEFKRSTLAEVTSTNQLKVTISSYNVFDYFTNLYSRGVKADSIPVFFNSNQRSTASISDCIHLLDKAHYPLFNSYRSLLNFQTTNIIAKSNEVEVLLQALLDSHPHIEDLACSVAALQTTILTLPRLFALFDHTLEKLGTSKPRSTSPVSDYDYDFDQLNYIFYRFHKEVIDAQTCLNEVEALIKLDLPLSQKHEVIAKTINDHKAQCLITYDEMRINRFKQRLDRLEARKKATEQTISEFIIYEQNYLIYAGNKKNWKAEKEEYQRRKEEYNNYSIDNDSEKAYLDSINERIVRLKRNIYTYLHSPSPPDKFNLQITSLPQVADSGIDVSYGYSFNYNETFHSLKSSIGILFSMAEMIPLSCTQLLQWIGFTHFGRQLSLKIENAVLEYESTFNDNVRFIKRLDIPLPTSHSGRETKSPRGFSSQIRKVLPSLEFPLPHISPSNGNGSSSARFVKAETLEPTKSRLSLTHRLRSFSGTPSTKLFKDSNSQITRNPLYYPPISPRVPVAVFPLTERASTDPKSSMVPPLTLTRFNVTDDKSDSDSNPGKKISPNTIQKRRTVKKDKPIQKEKKVPQLTFEPAI